MSQLFICFGGICAFIGVVTRSLSSHAIKPFLLERGKLDNFNLAADYLLIHGLALIGISLLCHVYPDAKYERVGWAFLVGSLLFQGTVLIKSCISIHPLGFLTPLGGGLLMAGWGLLVVISLKEMLGK